MENPQYESMLFVARQRIACHTPEEIARHAAVSWRDDCFLVPSLGQTVAVALPSLEMTPRRDMWHALTLLHYLDLADGTALTGRMMAFGQYPDGMVRGGEFDRRVEWVIRQQLGPLGAEELRRRLLGIGAALEPSNADICARIPFAPRYPLWLRLWLADEEFPASGRLFVDEAAPHYLTVEDAVTVGDLVLELLIGGPTPRGTGGCDAKLCDHFRFL